MGSGGKHTGSVEMVVQFLVDHMHVHDAGPAVKQNIEHGGLQNLFFVGTVQDGIADMHGDALFAARGAGQGGQDQVLGLAVQGAVVLQHPAQPFEGCQFFREIHLQLFEQFRNFDVPLFRHERCSLLA